MRKMSKSEPPKDVHVSRSDHAMEPQHRPIKTSRPFEVIGLDIVGPLPITSSGYAYLMTTTCLYSNFTLACPLRNLTAAEIADKLLKEIIIRFHAPEKIFAIRGREFSVEINELLHKSIVKPPTTVEHVYHPQVDRLMQMTNQTFMTRFAKHGNTEQDDWDLLIGLIYYNINTTKESSTGFSPYSLMFGRHPNLISGIRFHDSSECNIQEPTDDHIQQYINAMKSLREEVKNKIKEEEISSQKS